MKRLAILMAVASLALPALAGAQGYEHRGHGGGRGEDHERGGGDRGGDRSDRGDRGDHGGGRRGYRDEPGGRGGPGPGYGYPGPRGGAYDGPGYGGPRSYRFVRGQMLPPEYRGYVVGDYERYHLRRPPRGYYWYRAGDDSSWRPWPAA